MTFWFVKIVFVLLRLPHCSPLNMNGWMGIGSHLSIRLSWSWVQSVSSSHVSALHLLFVQTFIYVNVFAAEHRNVYGFAIREYEMRPFQLLLHFALCLYLSVYRISLSPSNMESKSSRGMRVTTIIIAHCKRFTVEESLLYFPLSTTTSPLSTRRQFDSAIVQLFSFRLDVDMTTWSVSRCRGSTVALLRHGSTSTFSSFLFRSVFFLFSLSRQNVLNLGPFIIDTVFWPTRDSSMHRM